MPSREGYLHMNMNMMLQKGCGCTLYWSGSILLVNAPAAVSTGLPYSIRRTCALPAAPEALREALPLAEALRPRRLVSRELSRRDWLLFCRRDDSAERSLMA